VSTFATAGAAFFSTTVSTWRSAFRLAFWRMYFVTAPSFGAGAFFAGFSGSSSQGARLDEVVRGARGFFGQRPSDPRGPYLHGGFFRPELALRVGARRVELAPELRFPPGMRDGAGRSVSEPE
jgi:hypothetical protein